jgi:hypothetical protein
MPKKKFKHPKAVRDYFAEIQRQQRTKNKLKKEAKKQARKEKAMEKVKVNDSV